MRKILIILFILPFMCFAQLEQPKSNNIIIHNDYSLEYSEIYKIPKWSAYKFYKDMTIINYKRKSTFHIDSNVKNKVFDSDYKGSGYDRGHMTPLANFRYDYNSMIATNYYSNICPQTIGCNRGIWKRVENQVRKWVEKYDTLYIVSGPILSSQNKTIGSGIIVPSFFYKVILAWDGWDYKSIAFLIPNEKSDKNIFEFQVSIDYIETITNIDFFYRLPDNVENKLEKDNSLY